MLHQEDATCKLTTRALWASIFHTGASPWMQQPTTVAAWTLRSAGIDGHDGRRNLVAVLHFRDQ